VFAALGAQSASANSVLVNFAGASVSGGIYTYNYQANLAGSPLAPTQLQSGDSFVLTDVDGVSALTLNTQVFTPNAFWTVSLGDFSAQTNTTQHIGTVDYTNNTVTPDLLFTYIGSTIGNDAFLGTFKIVTSVGTSAKHMYQGNDHEQQAAGGSFDPTANYGAVLTPDQGGGPTPLPLPATAAGGVALFGASLLRNSRRRA
jgi:hypothetical protein